MSINEHNPRAIVMHRGQHILRHSADELQYSHPALEGASNLKSAIDWLFAVLYPRTQDAVATPGDLPLVGNTLLDYRVVSDDGDGRAASYRWEQREGEVSASWHKIYDMDWGEDSVLSGFLAKTQDLYIYRYGYDDLDADGDPVTGVLAGQTIFGGQTANTNLTLFANSGDGTGASTGYVQFGDNVRPIATATYALGTTAARFTTGWFATLVAGTLTMAGGSITDSSGAISFGDENLTTTGTLQAGAVTGSSFIVSDTTYGDGVISRAVGTGFSFGALNVATTGYLQGTSLKAGTLTVSDGSIVDSDGTISFGSTALSTSGTLGAGAITGTSLAVDNLSVDGNTVLAGTGNLVLASTSGTVNVTAGLVTAAITATGVGAVIGSWQVDNVLIDLNTVSSTNSNGNLILSPNGTGIVSVTSNVYPSTDAGKDLGATATRWRDVYMSGSINDGTTSIASSVLQSLRDINSGVGSGYSIFWNGSKWVASLPDTEVDHGTISGLGDDDHAQYALLAGRSGGQTFYGDTASSGNLTISPTAHATKGAVIWEGQLRPTGDKLVDIGDSSHRVKDAYIGGELIGARLQNATTAGRPSASASNKGRIIYDTDLEDMFIDRGGSWVKFSVEKYENQDASGWAAGNVTSVVYTVSSQMSDARTALWQFLDNANGYRQIQATITKTQTQVTVTVQAALPAGTYTLIGIG